MSDSNLEIASFVKPPGNRLQITIRVYRSSSRFLIDFDSFQFNQIDCLNEFTKDIKFLNPVCILIYKFQIFQQKLKIKTILKIKNVYASTIKKKINNALHSYQ